MTVDHSSPYDSKRFDFPIHRAECSSLAEADSAVALAEASGAQLLILRFPAQHRAFGWWLGELPCRWVFADTLVYYKRLIEGTLELPVVEGYRQRLAVPSDAPAVEELMLELFADYASHYRWNPRTDNAGRVAEGYGEWARRSVEGGQSFTFLLESSEGEIVAAATTEVQGDVGVMPLAGVSSRHGRRGLYRWVMDGTHNQFFKSGQRYQEISTQVHNLLVQKVWSRCGMVMHRANQTVHIDLRKNLEPGPP